MIARVWSGRTLKSLADEYLDYVLKTGVKDFHRTSGIRGSWVFRRFDGEEAEFVMVSFWDKMESIGAFAGEEVERARYCPEDGDFLLEKTATVTHYEVADYREAD
jgi:hypothetical protein